MPALVIGLGNPGKEYERTRHNVGFGTVEAFRFARRDDFAEWKGSSKFLAKVAAGKIGAKKVILLQPQTFMNNSGDAALAAAGFWKIAPKDVIVVYDDLDLPVGSIRVRAEGSAGGHKGMRSIIERLGTQTIKRIRIGVAGVLRDRVPADKYVLEKFGKNEEPLLEEARKKAVEAIGVIIAEGIDEAMNRFNRES